MKLSIISLNLFLIIFISCSDPELKDANILWEKAKTSYSLNDFDDSVISLNQLISKFPDSKLVVESYYLLHEVFLNEFNNYDISIIYLNIIIDEYPEHELAKKSLFTLGYIYSNHISSYSDAYDTYNQFIEKYPNDDLVPSAEYEINNLKPILLDIEKLINKK